MQSPILFVLAALLGCCALSGAFVPPAPLSVSSPAARALGRRNAVWGGPEGEPPRYKPTDPRTREREAEEWFAKQAEREANGELNLLENPAFYGALFVAVPMGILVCGFASGVIPGFVPVQPDYSFVEEGVKSMSYNDLTGAASAAAEQGGSLF